MGDGWRTAAALEGLAVVAVSQNRPRGGLRLGGAAAGLRVRLGTPLVAFERASLDQALSSARAALSEQATTAWLEGQTLPPDQVAREAFRTADARNPALPAAADHEELRELTRREREVALLVARGLHNRQIGHDLGVREHTVEVHVSSILGKLGLTGRARLAAWVVEHDLAAAGRGSHTLSPTMGG